jgi:hypothetical protein
VAAPVLDLARTLPPAVLRSLDAIHVATAKLTGEALDQVITYDKRMAAAATAVGVPTVSPLLTIAPVQHGGRRASQPTQAAHHLPDEVVDLGYPAWTWPTTTVTAKPRVRDRRKWLAGEHDQVVDAGRLESGLPKRSR